MTRFAEWSRDVDAPIDYQALKARLDFLAEHLFVDYEPTRSHGPHFEDRLIQWLDSIGDEEDQRLLFELAGYLYFVGVMEMELLYEDVFNGPIMWWLTEVGDIDITSADLKEKLAEAVETTWFCPITDSMQIARFHHINRIEGKNLRPDWHTLAKLGSAERLVEYAERQGVTRLVLLEDFVGTGNQASTAIKFAIETFPEKPILIAPLIIAPQGVDKIRGVIADTGTVKFEPVVPLGLHCLLKPEFEAGESDRFASIRSMLERVRGLVAVPSYLDEREQVYGFGIVGALSVLYTNCPNNVLPAIHHKSDQWNPLFPRSIRR